MIEIKTVSYEELPEEVDKDWVPNNGSGKEYAQYLLFYENGIFYRYESDAMEPEDVTFSRNLSWIKDAIMEAYKKGKDERK